MNADLIEALKDEQQKRCAYGSREGDGRTCDCKYAHPFIRATSETTGCPELRSAIWTLTATQPRDDQGDGGESA